MTEVCEEVKQFAERMQYKLDKNKDKPCDGMNPEGGGRTWKHCNLYWLLLRLREETIELEKALEGDRRGDDVLDEAADVGNFAMMIFDVAKEKQK